MRRSPFDEPDPPEHAALASQDHAGATQAPPATRERATRRPTYSELWEAGQGEIDALRERIERLESWLTIARAEASLYRAHLVDEGIKPYDTGG